MPGVKHGESFYLCIQCLLSKDDISANAHMATRYETPVGNAHNKSIVLQIESVFLQRIAEKMRHCKA